MFYKSKALQNLTNKKFHSRVISKAVGSFEEVFAQSSLYRIISNIDTHDFTLEEHKTGLEELHESLSLVSGSLSLVWVDIFLTCFSMWENSRKTHFHPKVKETQFCPQFVLSFLL